MSRTTKFFDATPTNLGPLTTTFSAPSACSTQPPNWGIFSDTHNSRAPGPMYYGVNGTACVQYTMGDCMASGAKYDEVASANRATLGDFQMPYFSPGLYCPSGWETVGAASGRPSGDMHAAPKSATGVFTKDPWPYAESNSSMPVNMPLLKHYLGILGDSETLVWCCPSGFKADINGGCTSTVGLAKTMSVSEACNSGFTGGDATAKAVTEYDGTTYNPPLVSFTVVGSYAKANISRTIPKTKINDDMAVMSSVPMVALIHDEKDKDKGSAGARAGASVFGLVMASFAVLGLVV